MSYNYTKHPENVSGIYYVNDQCIDCDLCRLTAPDNFRRHETARYCYVFKQPENPEEEALCKESMGGCPVDAIWNNGDGIDRTDERKTQIAVHDEVGPEDDEDRIDCPFCGKMQYPGSGTAYATVWTWDEDSRCEHLLFLALDISGYSGFQYQSKEFNQHLGLDHSQNGELLIPSKDDPEEYLTVAEIIDLVTLPGLEIRCYEDPGGFACGPVGGGIITFGFVPPDTSKL